MSHIRKSAVLILAASLLLTGCAFAGPGSSHPVATLSAAPATGEQVTGDGYSFTVPEGWGYPEQGVTGQTAATFAADLTDDDGFSDNVNVLASPAGKITAGKIETAGVDELKDAGAKDIEVGDRVSVAGSESAHLSAKYAASGVEYRIEQFYVSNDTQTYVVTFSFSESVPKADREKVAESMLVTWRWS